MLIDAWDKPDGYYYDITRSTWFGQPTDEYRKVWSIVLEAQGAAIERAAPGVPCSEVDAAARRVIEKAGYGEYFTHRLGHGLGHRRARAALHGRARPDDPRARHDLHLGARHLSARAASACASRTTSCAPSAGPSRSRRASSGWSRCRPESLSGCPSGRGGASSRNSPVSSRGRYPAERKSIVFSWRRYDIPIWKLRPRQRLPGADARRAQRRDLAEGVQAPPGPSRGTAARHTQGGAAPAALARHRSCRRSTCRRSSPRSGRRSATTRAPRSSSARCTATVTRSPATPSRCARTATGRSTATRSSG